MFNPLIEDVKNTITELLKLYHDYIDINEKNRELADEMEQLAQRNQGHTLRYKNMMDSNPDTIAPYARHIEALLKLSPALQLCMQEHSLQIQQSLPRITQLTEALNAVESIVNRGVHLVSHEDLSFFNRKEKGRATELKTAFPELERAFLSIRLRFNTIKKELDVYEAA